MDLKCVNETNNVVNKILLESKSASLKILNDVVIDMLGDKQFSVKRDFQAFHREALKRAQDLGATKIISYDVMDVLERLNKKGVKIENMYHKDIVEALDKTKSVLKEMPTVAIDKKGKKTHLQQGQELTIRFKDTGLSYDGVVGTMPKGPDKDGYYYFTAKIKSHEDI